MAVKKEKSTTRDRIVKAALDTFDNLDFHEATIKCIVEKSGVTAPIIYKHFKNKEELANVVASEKMRQLICQIEEVLSGVQDVREKLRRMTYQYLQFYEQNPNVAWILYISTSVKAWRESPDAWQVLKNTGEVFARLVQDGQTRKEIKQDINWRLIRHMYFGCLKETAQMWLVGSRSYSIAALTNDVADAIFEIIKEPQTNKC